MKNDMKKIIAMLAAFSFAFSVPAFAESLGKQQAGVDFEDTDVSDAEITLAEETFTTNTPADNVFYPLKRFAEGIRLVFTFDKAEKARLHLEFAKERLAEVRDLIAKNKTNQARQLLNDFSEEINQTVNVAKEARGIGRNVSALVKDVDDVTSKSALVLELVLQKVPEQARAAIERALNNSLEKKVRVEAENETEEEIEAEVEEELAAQASIRKGVKERSEVKTPTARAVKGGIKIERSEIEAEESESESYEAGVSNEITGKVADGVLVLAKARNRLLFIFF